MTQILTALEEQLQTELSLEMLEQAGISVDTFDEIPALISTLSGKVVEMAILGKARPHIITAIIVF